MPHLLPYVQTVYPSLARTATPTAVVLQNTNGYRGLRLYIDVTAIAATPSVVPEIEIQDPIGLDWKEVLAGAALTAAITEPIILEIYPGEVAVANTVANRHVGRKVRVLMTHADADSITYSVCAEWLN